MLDLLDDPKLRAVAGELATNILPRRIDESRSAPRDGVAGRHAPLPSQSGEPAHGRRVWPFPFVEPGQLAREQNLGCRVARSKLERRRRVLSAVATHHRCKHSFPCALWPDDKNFHGMVRASRDHLRGLAVRLFDDYFFHGFHFHAISSLMLGQSSRSASWHRQLWKNRSRGRTCHFA